MKSRFNCYFDPKLADRLTELSLRQGVHRSQIVEAAVASFLSPDALDRQEAAYVRRLDRLSRQLERIERDLTIAIEAQALFVRFWLSVTAPLAPSQQAAAKAQGAQRYQSYIETLGRRLQRGDSLVREISEEIWPERRHAAAAPAADFTPDDPDPTSDDGNAA
jgi:Ribbon-helix-helix domain